MKRERNWIEHQELSSPRRVQLDANFVAGEPAEMRARHTMPGDRSGELWFPGWG